MEHANSSSMDLLAEEPEYVVCHSQDAAGVALRRILLGKNNGLLSCPVTT